MKKIFVSDLDWTLLHGSILSQFSRDKIIQILADDKVSFTVASARSLTTINELLFDIPFQLPVIQLNGACITDFHSKNDLVLTSMQGEYSKRLFELFKEYQANYLVTGVVDKKSVCLLPKERNEVMEEFYLDRIYKKDSRVREIRDPQEIIDLEVLSMTLIEPYERNQEITELVKQEIENIRIYPMGVDHKNWEWTTFQANEASKGSALEKLCDLYGYSIEASTSFGDNINDISMIQKAGTGIAVKNAIPFLKEHAQKIIGSCYEDSVVKYIMDQY